MKKQVIVPFFLSHQGCPHRCIFCDQTAITGSKESIPSPFLIKETVEAYKRSGDYPSVDIAFYGGSFTFLPVVEQQALLRAASELKQAGEVGSVRISTRPDGINEETINFLRDMGVDIVELGVQSMDDDVLLAAGRGHDSNTVVEAARVISAAGLQLGMQLMPGLPGDDAGTALLSLQKVLSLRPDFLRIYPAVVVEGTELANLYGAGKYNPLTVAEVVTLGKMMLHQCYRAEVPVIRFGLHPTDDLQRKFVVAGPFHPALRQLVESALMYDLLFVLVRDLSSPVSVRCHPARISDVIGQGRGNLLRLKAEQRIVVAKVIGDSTFERNEIAVSSSEGIWRGNVAHTINYQ